MGNRNRVPLTAQLVPGADDDIISWLDGIPQGQRAPAIKKAVRAGLGFVQPQGDEKNLVTYDDLEQMKRQLDEWAGLVTDNLRGEMIRMVRDMVAAGTMIGPPPILDDQTQITQEKKSTRDRRIKSAKW